jgi:hypothetical protein
MKGLSFLGSRSRGAEKQVCSREKRKGTGDDNRFRAVRGGRGNDELA